MTFIISAIFLVILFFLTILDEPWYRVLRLIFLIGVICISAYLFIQEYFSESDDSPNACFVLVGWIWISVAAERLNHQRGGSILGFFRKTNFHYYNNGALVWLVVFALTSFFSFSEFQSGGPYFLRKAYLQLWLGILQISIAAIGFIRASSPCTFRDKGITLTECGLIKWNNIDSYSWDSEHKNELCLILKGKRRYLKKKCFSIVLDDKLTAEKFLTEHLPPRSTSAVYNDL